MFKTGTALVAIGYLLLSVSALMSTVYVSNHPHELHSQRMEFSSSWAVVNQLVVGVFGGWLVYSQLRIRSKAAFVILAACAATMLSVRLRIDPACFGALHEHGCHTFLAAIILVVVGLLLCARETLGTSQYL